MVHKQKGGFPFESGIADTLFWVFIILLVVGIVILSLWLTGNLTKSAPAPVKEETPTMKLENLKKTSTNTLELTYTNSDVMCTDCLVLFDVVVDGLSNASSGNPYPYSSKNTITLDIPVLSQTPKDIEVQGHVEYGNNKSTSLVKIKL
jgi:hypothetical protein